MTFAELNYAIVKALKDIVNVQNFYLGCEGTYLYAEKQKKIEF